MRNAHAGHNSAFSYRLSRRIFTPGVGRRTPVSATRCAAGGWQSDVFQLSVRCMRCGSKGADLQHPSARSSDIALAFNYPSGGMALLVAVANLELRLSPIASTGSCAEILQHMSQNTGIRPRSVLVPSKIALAPIAMWIGVFQQRIEERRVVKG